jgi:cytochrome c2
MLINHADPASAVASEQDPVQKPPPRPALWIYGLVAAVAAAFGWFAAGVTAAPRGLEEPVQAGPAPVSLPILPLTGTILAIILVTGVWLSGESWMAANESEAVARALTSGNPAKASLLVTRYGCAGCHTIPGLPAADGKVGPPLGGLRQRVFIAGVLPNSADNLINWIVDPRAYSPRSAMPVTGISKAEARDVAAWLYAH